MQEIAQAKYPNQYILVIYAIDVVLLTIINHYILLKECIVFFLLYLAVRSDLYYANPFHVNNNIHQLLWLKKK